jgi:septal ring factor EnvC (AmiA/AmiB activator)
MVNKLLLILGGLFLMGMLAVAVGLGVWAYSLNIQLTQAHADYQSLKNSDEKLNSGYNDLNTTYAKTQADLAAAQSQIESLRGQLKTAQAENDSLKAKIAAVEVKVSILYTWEFGSETAFNAKVNSSNDTELKVLWSTLQKTKSKDDTFKLSDYLVQSIADSLGLGMLPFMVRSGALIGRFA